MSRQPLAEQSYITAFPASRSPRFHLQDYSTPCVRPADCCAAAHRGRLSPPPRQRFRCAVALIKPLERDREVTEKILVVDDSSDTREMMTKLLELESFDVITAEDGRIGFDTAKAERPDIIITDINMPNLNGIEMIRLLRSEVDLSSVPIMAITAYGQNVAQEAVEAGADQATTKPIEFDSLIRGIRQLLAARKGEGQANDSA